MKQVITIFFYLMINQICLAQDNSKATNKNALPDTCYTLNKCQIHYRHVVNFWFYADGKFKIIHDYGNGRQHYSTGTYFFQPESGEVFLSILKQKKSKKTRTKKYSPPQRLCFNIEKVQEDEKKRAGEGLLVMYNYNSAELFYYDWEVNKSNFYEPFGEASKFSEEVVYPEEIMEDMEWTFTNEQYASMEKFVKAVNEYQANADTKWNPDEIAFKSKYVTILFGKKHFDLHADGDRFIVSELLFKIHNHLAGKLKPDNDNTFYSLEFSEKTNKSRFPCYDLHLED